MNDKYTTIVGEATAELEEKRSIFISHISHVSSENEAMTFVKDKQKKYRDATHNVWAYHMKNGILARYSDDGEPTGTAGMPTLEAIRKSGVDDICIVVTRYFGGVLLGAGGLVRAYSKAASLAIQAASIVTYEGYSELELNCGYSDYTKLNAELSKYGVKLDSIDYSESIIAHIAVKEALTEELIHKISELTAGRATVRPIGTRLDI